MGVQNKVKEVVSGFKKTLNSIKNSVKFFASQIGWIVLILIAVVILVVVIVILVQTIARTLGEWLGMDMGTPSAEGDYNYLVSSIGYAGYDSLITEQKWQEYIAFEYAVLMDVAEYIAEGQEAFANDESDSYTLINSEKRYNPNRGTNRSETIKNPTYLPLLPVKCDYDLRGITEENWRKAVMEGQASPRFRF